LLEEDCSCCCAIGRLASLELPLISSKRGIIDGRYLKEKMEIFEMNAAWGIH
jgi:hypothetical protein